MRIDKLRVTLFLLVACSVSVSLNFFFKSHLTAGTRIRQKDTKSLALKDGVSGTKDSKDLAKAPDIYKPLISTSLPDQTLDTGNALLKVTDNLNSSEAAHGSAETSNLNDSLTGANGVNNETQQMVTDGGHWCPDTPPVLEGPLAVMQQEVIPQELVAWYPDFEAGGRLRPKDCFPRQRLAIIIPYRNRYPHLHIMINNLVPVLQRQQADVTFFVIEQAPPETFNRGALLNIGYLEANKVGDFDCFIFHDVDLIPLNDRNLYRCGDHPRHFAVSMNKFGYHLLYKGYFGGVVGFTKQQYSTVNGCSNIYFGWGGEDDDLLYRLRNKNYTMARYDTITARYDMIKHTRDKGNEENPFRSILLTDVYRRQDQEGLSTTKYRVNSISTERLYTWINVSLNMTEIIYTAPAYTLQLIKSKIDKMKEGLKSKQLQKLQKPEKRETQFKAELSLTISLVTPKSLRKFFNY